MITNVSAYETHFPLQKPQLALSVRVKNMSNKTKEFKVSLYDNKDAFVDTEPDTFWKNISPNQEADFRLSSLGILTPQNYGAFDKGVFKITAYTVDNDGSQSDEVYFDLSKMNFSRFTAQQKAQVIAGQNQSLALQQKKQVDDTNNFFSDIRNLFTTGTEALIITAFVVGIGIVLTFGLSKVKK